MSRKDTKMNEFINLIKSHEEEILMALREADKSAYINPNCEYRVYLTSGGNVECDEWLCGDQGWYPHRDGDIYIATMSHPYYSILWDYWFNDEYVFRNNFRFRFGCDIQPVLDEDGDEVDVSLYDVGRHTADIHGIPAREYEAWLSEEEDEAFEEVLEDTDYSEYLRDFMRL